MKSWIAPLGWTLCAAGAGLAALGLMGPGEALHAADTQLRQGLIGQGLRWREGPASVWAEEPAGEGWRWRGWNPQAKAEIPLTFVGVDSREARDLDEPAMGPLDLAATLRALRGETPRTLVVGSWPARWRDAGGMTLKALSDELEEHPQLVAGAVATVTATPLAEERRGLELLAGLPLPPEGLELGEVDGAGFGWPNQAAAGVFWAPVPGLGLVGASRSGPTARVPLLLREGERLLPTLPLAAALQTLVARPWEIRWKPGRVLSVGDRWQVTVDARGCVEVPVAAGQAGEGWGELGYEQLIGYGERGEDGAEGVAAEGSTAEGSAEAAGEPAPAGGAEAGPGAGAEATGEPTPALTVANANANSVEAAAPVEAAAEEEIAPLPSLAGRVVWIDDANPGEGGEGQVDAVSAGWLRARALGVLLNPAWRVQELPLRPVPVLGTVMALAVAGFVGPWRRGRAGWTALAVVAPVLLLLLGSLALAFSRHWWVSPLPGLISWGVAALGLALRREDGPREIDQSKINQGNRVEENDAKPQEDSAGAEDPDSMGR